MGRDPGNCQEPVKQQPLSKDKILRYQAPEPPHEAIMGVQLPSGGTLYPAGLGPSPLPLHQDKNASFMHTFQRLCVACTVNTSGNIISCTLTVMTHTTVVRAKCITPRPGPSLSGAEQASAEAKSYEASCLFTRIGRHLTEG